MIVSIFGQSCVGKSTVAKLLSAELGLPLRSCGEEIKNAAKALGLDFLSLTDEDHREVDRQTLSWALDKCSCIVEGRFLDQVLYGLPVMPFSVCLAANADVRYERSSKRSNGSAEANELIKGDRVDSELRLRLYGDKGVLNPSISIDTSNLTVAECVNQIKAATSNWPKRLT
jgi:cytidylate kinase